VLRPDSLLLYKNRPARLLSAGDRLEIELESGEKARVREKDVELLHPGPLGSLGELKPREGDVRTAWEILAGQATSLAELAELAYGAYTPATAWAAWQHVAAGLYFHGKPGALLAYPVEAVERREQERKQSAEAQGAWNAFLDRLRGGRVTGADAVFLRDVEDLALGRGQRGQALKALGRSETPENAHALLLELGLWDVPFNPYPLRQGVQLQQPDLPIPDLPEEDRRNLTGLQAFAIDDEGTDTPDDALSLDGDRLWVHVADAAALAPPGSPLDLDARGRGMSLHLPEGTIAMLPGAVVEQLGLGLNEISPALSFGIDLAEDGQATGFEVVPSWVKVRRLTYGEAELLIEREPFRGMARLAGLARERRQAAGAVKFDFPEVRLAVKDGQVEITPLPPLRSRALVEELMILAGAETARFAARQEIVLPYSHQEAAGSAERPESLAGMFALRRLLKRSRYRAAPGPHSGLGLPAYSQVTSPLRRYLDLAGHQQLRAFLKGGALLGETEILERIGSVEAVIDGLRRAELLSERHWTLVYLLQHPDWRGEGIVVDQRGSLAVIIIPALALETRLYVKRIFPLDQVVSLSLASVDLPQREASFRIE
jgi:exoribonuclease-2